MTSLKENGRFLHPWLPPHRVRLRDFLAFQRAVHQAPWPSAIDDVVPARAPLNPPKGLGLTFVNHATVLLEFQNTRVLTDPIFSSRASPVSFAGPKRSCKAGMRLMDLPPIDLVLISHNHYDHMDIPSLKKIDVRNPACLFIVPLGNAKTMAGNGLRNVVELDWEETYRFNHEVTVHCQPSQHWSARGLFDHCKALWGSFVLSTPLGPIYFAGDTGYGPHFKATAEKFPGIRLSFLPIGAYSPRWFLKPIT